MFKEALIVGAVTLAAACGGSGSKDNDKPFQQTNNPMVGPVLPNSNTLRVTPTVIPGPPPHEMGGTVNCAQNINNDEETAILPIGQRVKFRDTSFLLGPGYFGQASGPINNALTAIIGSEVFISGFIPPDLPIVLRAFPENTSFMRINVVFPCPK